MLLRWRLRSSAHCASDTLFVTRLILGLGSQAVWGCISSNNLLHNSLFAQGPHIYSSRFCTSGWPTPFSKRGTTSIFMSCGLVMCSTPIPDFQILPLVQDPPQQSFNICLSIFRTHIPSSNQGTPLADYEI